MRLQRGKQLAMSFPHWAAVFGCPSMSSPVSVHFISFYSVSSNFSPFVDGSACLVAFLSLHLSLILCLSHASLWLLFSFVCFRLLLLIFPVFGCISLLPFVFVPVMAGACLALRFGPWTTRTAWSNDSANELSEAIRLAAPQNCQNRQTGHWDIVKVGNRGFLHSSVSGRCWTLDILSMLNFQLSQTQSRTPSPARPVFRQFHLEL